LKNNVIKLKHYCKDSAGAPNDLSAGLLHAFLTAGVWMCWRELRLRLYRNLIYGPHRRGAARRGEGAISPS
jgi:hypothetical protein